MGGVLIQGRQRLLLGTVLMVGRILELIIVTSSVNNMNISTGMRPAQHVGNRLVPMVSMQLLPASIANKKLMQ